MTDKKRRVFSYLRKSTKKDEQESSIERQKSYVNSMARKLGIDTQSIEYFEDIGKSGYKGSAYIDSKSESLKRTRFGYSGMISEIRRQKLPCRILAWTISRIARDTKEGGTIYNLLGNNLKGEQKIEFIYFLDGTRWDNNTPQEDIYEAIAKEEKSSREKSVWQNERTEEALLRGLYPNEFKPPKGLINTGVRIKKSGVPGGKLKITDDIKFIKEAFNQKYLGYSNANIHKYLISNNINISLGNISNSVFKNTVYNGFYRNKKTGNISILKFEDGGKPISDKLFQDVQKKLGRKNCKYGEKQKQDLLATILRTNSGRRFSLYTPKGKTAKQYKNATEKIHKSQRQIFSEFEDVLNRIFFLQYKLMIPYLFNLEERRDIIKKLERDYSVAEDTGTKHNIKESIDLNKEYLAFAEANSFSMEELNFDDFKRGVYKDLISRDSCAKIPYHFHLIKGFDSLEGQLGQDYYLGAGKTIKVFQSAKDKMRANMKDLILQKGNIDLLEKKGETDERIKKLTQEKSSLQVKIKGVQKDAFLRGYSIEIANEVIGDINKEIKEIEGDILELENNSLTEKELDKFIEALENIFEHIKYIHVKGKERISEDDMLHLIKLTTFELIINPSGKLDIELFEGLKKVLYNNGIPSWNRTNIYPLGGGCSIHGTIRT